MGEDADVRNLVRDATSSAVVQSGSIQNLTMQTASSASGAVVPRQVPLVVRDFVGRHAELELLDAWLAGREEHAAAKVATVVGTAGVGKTTLAVRWANHVRGHFPDGQFFADLHGFDPAVAPADPAAVLEDFLRVLGADTRWAGCQVRPVPVAVGRPPDAARAGQRGDRRSGPAVSPRLDLHRGAGHEP